MRFTMLKRGKKYDRGFANDIAACSVYSFWNMVFTFIGGKNG